MIQKRHGGILQPYNGEMFLGRKHLLAFTDKTASFENNVVKL